MGHGGFACHSSSPMALETKYWNPEPYEPCLASQDANKNPEISDFGHLKNRSVPGVFPKMHSRIRNVGQRGWENGPEDSEEPFSNPHDS